MYALIGLSGIACIVLGVPITGFILLYKLFKKQATDKDKKRPVIVMSIGIVLLIVGLVLTPSDGNATESTTERNESTTETVVSEKKDETTDGEDEKRDSFNYADMNVKFLEYKIEEDAAGTQCLVLYFDFTNNAKDSYAFGYTFDVKAFQDGVELEPTYFHVNDETHNAEKEIKTGVTLKVAEQFELKDVSGEIEIEIEPFNIWSDKTLFTYEFNLD